MHQVHFHSGLDFDYQEDFLGGVLPVGYIRSAWEVVGVAGLILVVLEHD